MDNYNDGEEDNLHDMIMIMIMTMRRVIMIVRWMRRIIWIILLMIKRLMRRIIWIIMLMMMRWIIIMLMMIALPEGTCEGGESKEEGNGRTKQQNLIIF